MLQRQQSLGLVRNASRVVGVFEAGAPALKRGTTYAPVSNAFQLPTFEIEDDLIQINTGDQNAEAEEEGPAIAFREKTLKN